MLELGITGLGKSKNSSSLLLGEDAEVLIGIRKGITNNSVFSLGMCPWLIDSVSCDSLGQRPGMRASIVSLQAGNVSK
jgi:hypothetical protein